jgi:sec-independent protein translocase protein TatA
MFQNLGFTEILLILVVVLLLFGAKRLPEIGSSFGKGIREFQNSFRDIKRDVIEAPTHTESVSSGTTPRSEEEARPEPKRLLS